MTRPLLPILGGTFDPIHNGHLRCAWEIAEWTGAPVRVMPAGEPGHRAPPAAGVMERWRMVCLALTAHGKRLIACDREIRRPGPTYSVDTLEQWRQDRPQAAFCLIVGADAFGGLQRWKDWRRLAELTHFIVIGRPATDDDWPPSLAEWAAARRADRLDDLRQNPAGRIIFREVTALDISATTIRQLVAAGREPAFLVPQAVSEYIREQQLYRAGDHPRP